MTEQMSILDALFGIAEGLGNGDGLVMQALSDKVKSKSLRSRLLRGERCPCCGRHMQMYRYTITGEMVRVLIFLSRLFEKYPHCQPVQLESVLRRVYKDRMPRGNKYPLLRHWGLIERVDTRFSKHLGKNTIGCWKVTAAGQAFVRGEISIERYVFIYDDKCYGQSIEDPIRVYDCIGKKFSLESITTEEINWSEINIMEAAA